MWLSVIEGLSSVVVYNIFISNVSAKMTEKIDLDRKQVCTMFRFELRLGHTATDAVRKICDAIWQDTVS
jgi:hypothetical protein